MKVLATRRIFIKDMKYIRSKLKPDIDFIIPVSFDEKTIIQNLKGVDVLWGNYFTEKILYSATDLKYIQVPWTGVDNIDFDLLKQYDITLCNSHSNSEIVAEHAVAMMFSAAKKIPYHDSELRKGNWNRPNEDDSNSVSPFSKRLMKSNIGIIGFGSIGSKIFKILKSLDSKFYISDSRFKEYKNENDIFYYPISRSKEVLTNADYLFISVPLTEQTRGMVSAKFLKEMKKNSFLINISRGEIINEPDLFEALKSNYIGGAAIDTWLTSPNKNKDENFPSERYDFHHLKNLIISPHRAGMIEDGFPHLDDAIDNLNKFISGESLKNIVSLTKKY